MHENEYKWHLFEEDRTELLLEVTDHVFEELIEDLILELYK